MSMKADADAMSYFSWSVGSDGQAVDDTAVDPQGRARGGGGKRRAMYVTRCATSATSATRWMIEVGRAGGRKRRLHRAGCDRIRPQRP
jgi:hypothetical protein